MKKTGMMTAAICVALSFSALILPGYASAELKKEADVVMEKEAPREYMEDFNVEGTQEAKRKLIDTVFLSDSQIEPLKASAEKAFLEILGVEIPREMEFEYHTMEYEGVKISLSWSDNKDPALASTFFSASFTTKDLQNKPAVLTEFVVNNGYDIEKLDGLTKQGLEALNTELGITVPEDYFMDAHVVVYLTNGQPKDIVVTLNWAEGNNNNPSYMVMFDKVDLLKNTGRITGLKNKGAVIYQDEAVISGTAKFTAVQEEELLKAAKQFLSERGIGVGSLTRAHQMGEIMWFVFDTVAENDSTRTFVDIEIKSDFEVLGYIY